MTDPTEQERLHAMAQEAQLAAEQLHVAAAECQRRAAHLTGLIERWFGAIAALHLGLAVGCLGMLTVAIPWSLPWLLNLAAVAGNLACAARVALQLPKRRP